MHAAVTAESSPAWPAPGRAGVRFASCGLSSAVEVILRAPTSERYPPRGGTAAVRRGRASGDARVGGGHPRRAKVLAFRQFASGWFRASYGPAAVLRRDSDPS